MEMSHRTRRYGYRLKQRFREDPFSILVLYALFFSAIFLIFAFRGLIATVFIKPMGIINPGTDRFEPTAPAADATDAGDADTLNLKSTGTYTIKAGDTLAGVAAALELNWQELAELNKIAPPYSLAVGQVLQLPS